MLTGNIIPKRYIWKPRAILWDWCIAGRGGNTITKHVDRNNKVLIRVYRSSRTKKAFISLMRASIEGRQHNYIISV